jgi:hypothetical protein
MNLLHLCIAALRINPERLAGKAKVANQLTRPLRGRSSIWNALPQPLAVLLTVAADARPWVRHANRCQVSVALLPQLRLIIRTKCPTEGSGRGSVGGRICATYGSARRGKVSLSPRRAGGSGHTIAWAAASLSLFLAQPQVTKFNKTACARTASAGLAVPRYRNGELARLTLSPRHA